MGIIVKVTKRGRVYNNFAFGDTEFREPNAKALAGDNKDFNKLVNDIQAQVEYETHQLL